MFMPLHRLIQMNEKGKQSNWKNTQEIQTRTPKEENLWQYYTMYRMCPDQNTFGTQFGQQFNLI